MADTSSLLDVLADALPPDIQLRFYHISTPPGSSSPLFAAAPGAADKATFCESHFFAVSLPRNEERQEEILVFALEVLIFTTETLTTVFVSKADSTGYLHLLKAQAGTPSLVRTISTVFLGSLVQSRVHGPRLVLSLFARSQNQYLFPGSVENVGKHVLDDRQLIKWWCRALDPILRHYEAVDQNRKPDEDISITSCGYVIVPGCDRFETKAFFPPSNKSDNPKKPRWICSYPVSLITEDPSAPPRCLIPRLPDDPKSRFLGDLDGEMSETNGRWRSVRTLAQFWELMSYRQECSAGRLVGFVWVVFSPARREDYENERTKEESVAGARTQRDDLLLPTPGQSQAGNNLPPAPVLSQASIGDHIAGIASPPSSSPVAAAAEGLGGTEVRASRAGQEEQYYDPTQQIPVRWPESDRGELVIEESKYQLLMDHMLQLDFAHQAIAAQSTSDWILMAASLGEKASWGVTVTGRSSSAAPPAPKLDGGTRHVNVLTGIRRKRKANDNEDSARKGSAIEPAVNNLSAGLVKKKQKVVVASL